jgi:hypothetical protein
MTQAQSYENHAHRPTLSAIASISGFVALLYFVYRAIMAPSAEALALVLLGVAVLALSLLSRVYITRLQDRIIRTEMGLRLARLGRGADLGRLSIKQVTALRFASDAELPGLADRALAEHLSPDQIKRAVKDWQADHLRT